MSPSEKVSFPLQLNEVSRTCSDPDTESLFSFASSYDSNFDYIRPVTKVETVGQDDGDNLSPIVALPNISAAREIRAYERNRRQVRDTAKYALICSRRVQQVARPEEGRSPGERLQRDRKGDWGVRRVRHERSSTASLIQDTVEALEGDLPSILEESALWASEDNVCTPPSQDTCDRVLEPENVVPYDTSSGYYHNSCSDSTILQSKAAEDALPTINCDSDNYSTNAIAIDPLMQSISVTREVRSYEYNRVRTKNKAKLARAHERKRGLFNRSMKPHSHYPRTRSPIVRKQRRIRVVVDPKDDFGFVGDSDCEEDGDTLPIEVSLSAISPEEPSGRPFYISDLSCSIRKVSKGKEPGFELVPPVCAVIALDDEHEQEDEPWEHVWNDDLLDDPLLSLLDSR